MHLGTPLPDLVRPHHLTGYFGACKLRSAQIIERTGQQRHADETCWYIGRIARALQFMDATGLKPSEARRRYPERDWDCRPRVADHHHAWYDPGPRIHLLSIEPYPSRSDRSADAQAYWERKHGWTTFYVNWGGICGNGTDLILCCPEAYADTLQGKIARLEASPSAVEDSHVVIHTYTPASSRLMVVA